MSDITSEIRLVRCPKCEKLLPEVTGYSVYQCGGCGAVLRAKNKGVDLDTFSEKSNEEMVGNNTEKLSDRYEKMSVTEKRTMDLGDNSESDVRSNISSSSRAERRRILRDRADNFRPNLMNNEEKWEVEADEIQDKKRSNEFHRLKMSVPEKRTMDLGDNSEGDVRSTISSSSRAERRRILGERAENFRPNLMNNEEKWEVEADEIQDQKRSNEFHQPKIAHDFEDLTMYNENIRWPGRLVNGRNGEKKDMEGPFPYRSGYDYEHPTRNKNDIDGFNNVRDDREELLRKLEELQAQVSRSGNLTGKGKEKAPLDRRMAYQDPYASDNRYPDSSLGMNRPYHDAQFKRPNYPNQYSEPPPLMRREESSGNGFYPPRYAPSHVHGYEDPSRSHMLGRGPHQTPAPYPETRSHAYMMDPYSPNISRHHPSCSCYECCSNKRQVPPYGDNYYDGSNDTRYGYHENLSSFGSRDYNLRSSNSSSLRSHNPHSHTRWPSDLNSEVDGFTRRRLQRVHLPSGGKNCRPFAGGAPFLSCYNCFELLLLPKKVLIRNNNRKNVRCGACTTVIVFAVSEKNLVVFIDEEDKVDKEQDMPSTFGDENMIKERTAFSSEDFDNSDYDFQSMEDKNSMAARKDSNFADVATNGKESRPPAGSPLQNHFEFSNKFHAANRFEEGNKSGRSENNKELPNKSTTTRQRKESTATEIDLSSNEYCNNTGTTFDSGEASRECDNMKGSKIAKSFKDSNRSNRTDEEEKANVTVNGHLIPDRLIKKAEKMAGTIHPGNYWYDFRAGFWGAVGGSCLGIIPPFIEEFNYPMPEHCGGGNTHVYVNGRELNLKDLNLLGSRGLPTDRDRSYIIEISGRVLDEDTGEELDSLGKLAPTVEKAKRGFGMRDPNAALLSS